MTYCSGICGNARDHKHEVEGDDELEDKRLNIRPSRNRSKEILGVGSKQQAERDTRKGGSENLSRNISWNLQNFVSPEMRWKDVAAKRLTESGQQSNSHHIGYQKET